MQMRSFIAACLLCPSLILGGVSNQEVIERMDRDLDFVYNTIEASYGPFEWKVQHFNWDLAAEVDKAKQALKQAANPSYALYRQALKRLLLSMKDYHVSIGFYSTELSVMPFRIAGTDGRYFLSSTPGVAVIPASGSLPAQFIPLNVGDEVLRWNGRPIGDVIAEFKAAELSGAVAETDERLAQVYLTIRAAANGYAVPQGTVTLTLKSSKTGAIIDAPFPWQYHADEMINPPLTALGLNESLHAKKEGITFTESQADKMIYGGWKALEVAQEFQGKIMTSHEEEGVAQFESVEGLIDVFPTFESVDVAAGGYNDIGLRQSFIPDLGTKIWSSTEADSFYAYIFISPKGKRIGYVRIPSYQASTKEATAFGNLIAQYQAQTDALVIDEVCNPGGSIYYVYALASYLSNKPLVIPRHQVRLTQADVSSAMQSVLGIGGFKNDAEAQKFFGVSIDGYPVNMLLMKQMISYYQFLVDQWKQDKLLTDATPLFGIDQILPARGVVYTKPILVAINSLDFSGGDFFPAILQDNSRATLFGERTAGAGGYVAKLQFQNVFGVESIAYTASLADRPSHKPIENLGVTPDIPYKVTAADLQNGFLGYKAALLQAVDNLVR